MFYGGAPSGASDPMSTPSRHQTKTEFAVAFLRQRILDGELAPGDRLRAEDIADELGMSATPIREALRLLQADRLVEYKSHQSAVVAGLSTVEAREIYALRAVLEPLATKVAVPLLVDSALAKVERAHQAFNQAAEAERGVKVIAARNATWHWSIYETTEWTYLIAFIRQLWERFPWRTMWVSPESVKQSIEEHERVMEAIRAGDAGRAATRMREHVDRGREHALVRLASS
jgi:DNA-binding GntR family transcriptional regulator